MLPKAIKACPKSNKSPNLVILNVLYNVSIVNLSFQYSRAAEPLSFMIHCQVVVLLHCDGVLSWWEAEWRRRRHDGSFWLKFDVNFQDIWSILNTITRALLSLSSPPFCVVSAKMKFHLHSFLIAFVAASCCYFRQNFDTVCQCDQIWPKFTTLATFYEFLSNGWGFIQCLAICLN